jgi:hypothetical protein
MKTTSSALNKVCAMFIFMLLFAVVNLFADSNPLNTVGAKELFKNAPNGLGVVMRLLPSSSSANTLAAASLSSASTFDSLQRYPAEEQTWVSFQDTAYFRDIWIGANTTLNAVKDGQSWNFTAFRPDGTPLGWLPISYQENGPNGRQDCFSDLFETICGSKTLWVLWYTNAQCAPTGKWSMQLNDSLATETVGSAQFTLFKKINPEKVPPRQSRTVRG